MTPTSASQRGRTVRLVPLLRLYHLGDRRFDYLVPPELEDSISLGSIVRAPFGKRSVRAVVVGVDVDDPGAGEGPLRKVRMGSAAGGMPGGGAPRELRAIESVSRDRVPPDLLQLAERLSERYLAPYESCLRLAAPPEVGRAGGASGRQRSLWVVRCDAGRPTRIEEEGPRLTGKQQALLDAIPPEGMAPAEACATAGVGRGVLRTLIDKGLVRSCEPPDFRGDEAARSQPRAVEPIPTLWPEQEETLDRLFDAYSSSEYEHRLLWGITGSGKTEIYLRLIERALSKGEGSILLVPEIALTPQTISRVRERFGGLVGVLHSGLSKRERVEEYRRIAAGKAPVVVGARSAVFAPLPDVGLIIVDEAHDGSYKQEEEPRYHALVAARLRLEATGGLLVEGTATPSVESVRDAGDSLRLTRKAVGVEPTLEVVDMRTQGGEGLLAPRSRDALAEVLRRDEQVIVLLNRRGYAAHVHCESCGHVMACSDCELSLTFHNRTRRLLCHHCGRAYFQPPRCPACGGPPLMRGAPGTERLDEELRALVPRDMVFRMDSDVVGGGRRVGSILDDFGQSRPGVLVGTQMVAKGHDFPGVTLVLVADADTGLYVPDFRAAERTFQLLTQVAGRAGRADTPGRVLVQTWNPDVPCIRMALKRDEQGFYAEELRIRERLGYPPFGEIVRLLTVAEAPERAGAGARYLAERLSPYFGSQELRGPVRLPALRGRERWHLLVAATDGERMRAIVGEALAQLTGPYRRRGVMLLADVDPLSFG